MTTDVHNAVNRTDEATPFDPPIEKEYLSLEELVERIPYRPQTLRNLMCQGVLREGVHYFKPTQRAKSSIDGRPSAGESRARTSMRISPFH
jgi:hypothetical protein